MGYAAIQQRDRRRHRRYVVNGVGGTLVFPMRVEVLNMSLTGLAVESRRALEIGKRCDLELHNDREAIKISVDVQWCRLVRTERGEISEVCPVYQAGLDFRHVLSAQAQELLRFLEHNVVVDVERRLSGRLKVGLDQSTGSRAGHDFLVRQLSYLGMLIETDLMPQVGATFDLEMDPSTLRLKTRGKVIHAEPLARKSGCKAAIEFLRMPSSTRHALERLIEGFLE